MKTLIGIVNSYDPQDNLWQNTAVSVKVEDDKVLTTEQAKPYMKAMDGWIFTLRRVGKEAGVDLSEYSVYDNSSSEFHPMSEQDFKAMKEI